MLAHRFPIPHLPQKLEEHHQTTERGDRSLRLAQFHFFSAPKSANFPVHCFVLLGVSFIQLKLNRVRAKQCYLISEFRLNTYIACVSEHLDSEDQNGRLSMWRAFGGTGTRVGIVLRFPYVSISALSLALTFNPVAY